MTTVILRGPEAAHYAAVHHLVLNCDESDCGPARDKLSANAAERLLREHPEALWVETNIRINSADHD